MSDTTSWEWVDGYDNTTYSDDSIFTVDSRTKKIQTITDQTLVAGEDCSQLIMFEMDRYYDAVDLSEKRLQVIFQAENGYTDINSAVCVKRSADKLRFGWVVPGEALTEPGTLAFSIEAVGSNYVWKTRTYEKTIEDGLNGEVIIPEPTDRTWYIEIQSQCATAVEAAAAALAKAEAIINGIGNPTTARTAAEMTDSDAIYVYTGSETGYTYGNWYYYDGSAWVSGGKYASTALVTDRTLSQSGQAADAKVVGDEIDRVDSSLRSTNADVYDTRALPVNSSANGWRLNETNGLCSSDSSYKIVKYQVIAGDYIKVVANDRFQFQTVASVPSSGSSNRIGNTYSAGTYYLVVPATATYLVFSALITDGVAESYALVAKTDSLAERIESVADDASNINTLLDTKTVESVNKINPDKLVTGRYLYNGTLDSNTSYKTTDYIAVNPGDVLRLFKTIDNDGVNTERTTGERLALFDSNKTYLAVSGQYPCNIANGYTVENADAKYVRVSYSASFDPIELTINTTSGIGAFTPYTPATVESSRLLNIEKIIGLSPIKVIDCWGDSRTDIADDGTSYCDYLQTLIGNQWIVQNRGISGQASGQVAARFGSNEIFLTLQNNKIEASGSTLITAWKVTTGTDTNLRGGDSAYGVHGILNGVPGKYIHTTGGNINFVRDYEGAAVKVKPRTKLLPDPYFNADHCQILWCGKNDFSYAYPNVVSGIEGNYDGMVDKIPHDKFIILGETNGIGDTYLPGHSNRDYVDSINAYLAQKYPDNFIDIQAELIENGLTLEGITPTSADESNIANGWIPDSLMADDTHLNQYGREAIAKIIYAWIQEKGWA